MLLTRLLERIVRCGALTVIDARGRRHRLVGEDAPGLRPVSIRLHHPSLHRRLWLNPKLTLGEAYMDGTLTVEDGTLYDFLALCGANVARRGRNMVGWTDAAARALRRVQQFNPAGLARRNVAHHYDLSDALYDLFLDRDRQYSCAYFPHPDADLEEAQEAKKRHIAAKLLLEPGMRVLDIGCGWGGMALSLAGLADVHVTGITLSREQLRVARERAQRAGLGHRVEFHLRDYRHQEGRFERIVSVGMFEHVGVNHYRTFFRRLKHLLTPDGVALLHSIGRAGGPGYTDPWIRKYIFPGGYSPALSEVLPAVERTGLYVTDIEILRLHYAETLRRWRARLERNRERVRALYDERFCRMWEYYLTGSEVAFRHMGLVVFQMQMSPRIDAVPLTRDYITDTERRLQDRLSSVA